MTLIHRIQEDVKGAMRAQDKNRLAVLRLITAAIKQIEVDERITVDDARLLVVLDKMSKQRRESIEQFEKAAREDLIAQERFELEIIGEYLPEPLSDTEVQQLVHQAVKETDASAIADMSKVMAWIKPKVQGRADMGNISKLIKEILT